MRWMGNFVSTPKILLQEVSYFSLEIPQIHKTRYGRLLVVDPPQWNSTKRQNPPNPEKCSSFLVINAVLE